MTGKGLREFQTAVAENTCQNTAGEKMGMFHWQ